MNTQITDDELRSLGYHLWEQAGCPDGRADEFWEQARVQLGSDGRPTPADRMNDSDEFIDAPEGAPTGSQTGRSGRRCCLRLLVSCYFSSMTTVFAMRSCNSCLCVLKSIHIKPAPQVAKQITYPNVRRAACLGVIRCSVSASTFRRPNARFPVVVPQTAHMTPVTTTGMSWATVSQKKIDATACAGGALNKSTVDGPSGMKRTSTVHQMLSMNNAEARRE
jgi:hypothetical protein